MPFLEQTMRWFGPADAVTLSQIRQAGATGVVTALHHVAPGEIWTVDEIHRRQEEVEAAGLRWSVVESVPVHEDVKRQFGEWRRYLAHYRESIRNLGACGVSVVCYNFMAVTDWTRTDLDMRMPSGARALRFDTVDAACFDQFILGRPGSEDDYPDEVLSSSAARWESLSLDKRERLAKTILMGLPGTVKDLTVEEFRARLATYQGIDSPRLREHHAEFLRQVVPAAEESGVVLAMHPDDPPFPVFGLPRIAGTADDFSRIFAEADSPANGLTFCTGSLGSHPENDLPQMLRQFGDRIHFLHLRSVRRELDGSFFEDDHLAGSTDMVAILREAIALADRRGVALPIRPDHGHLIEGDANAAGAYPGYSFVGRLRGLSELRGLELGLRSAALAVVA